MAEKKIGDRTFKVSPLLAMQALELQSRLFKALGPAMPRLPAILSGMSSKTDEAKAAAEVNAISALIEVLGGAQPGETAALVKEIVELAMIRRQSGVYENVDIDHEFTGRLGDIPPVVIFVLQENFSDFFGDVLQAAGRQAARAA